ncbi:MAG TPA: class I SAM-dependent methyltransferase, partial [Chitinophagales bacterium]|nr:class I SAM-dependent methyltransferase [Chitinophagales bacterium]
MTVINSIPFFFKSHTDTNNGGLPQSLPFYLYYDNDLKMFRQKSTPELITVLDEVYKQGSLVEGSVSSESGKVYIEKMINYIFDHFHFKKDTVVLEVGFGSGILLKELKQKGIQHLTGIEPGNHKRVDGLKDIQLIKDFFPSEHFKIKADLIYSFGILEHIEDPLSFLTEQINQLSENGKIIFSVPNCEPYLKEGDLSVFIHEHYSYFTRESIIKLVNKIGFEIEDISVIEGA